MGNLPGNPDGSAADDIERAARVALARTLRDLRRSTVHGRTMSLPNLLRLYHRRIAPALPSPPVHALQTLHRAYHGRPRPF